MELKDIIEASEKQFEAKYKNTFIPLFGYKTPDDGREKEVIAEHSWFNFKKEVVAETAQIVAREVSESLVKVIDDYEQNIQKLHHIMMGTAHDDCKEMLAFDMHSRLIAIKHIKEKIDKELTHLQSLDGELTK